MTEPVRERPADPGLAIRETALDYAVRYHGDAAANAGSSPAAARTIVGTAQTFEQFLIGLADVASTRTGT